MVWYGMVWYGMVWQGKAGQGRAGQGRAVANLHDRVGKGNVGYGS